GKPDRAATLSMLSQYQRAPAVKSTQARINRICRAKSSRPFHGPTSRNSLWQHFQTSVPPRISFQPVRAWRTATDPSPSVLQPLEVLREPLGQRLSPLGSSRSHLP